MRTSRPNDSSMASTISSSFQQLSMSFGLATGSLVTAWFLGDVPQTNRLMVTSALHSAFVALSVVTILSSLAFWGLRREDGESISKGAKVAPGAGAGQHLIRRSAVVILPRMPCSGGRQHGCLTADAVPATRHRTWFGRST